MPIVQIFTVLLLVGLCLYLLSFVPIDAAIQQIIRAVAIVMVIIWLITIFFPALYPSHSIRLR